MKTSEVIDEALDKAVSYCVEWNKKFPIMPIQVVPYSTKWQYGGPIIEKEKIKLHCGDGKIWWAATNEDPHHPVSGPTPLIAAMRCFCVACLGDEFEILKEPS